MINETTTNKLMEMHLTAMATAFHQQQGDKKVGNISFEDRFGMLVDIEYTSRKNNRFKRLIHNAELEQADACMSGVDYHSGRKLNKTLINRLASCEYIAENRNIFITGATGSGKTYLAYAFGMEACKQYYSTRYIRLPDYLMELEAAKSENCYAKVLDKYAKPLLLIIDEWLLLKPTNDEQRCILELLHRRRRKSSTIFCSQYQKEGWYEQLGGNSSPLADAILDRIVHDAYIINIESADPTKDISMREVYGLNKSMRE